MDLVKRFKHWRPGIEVLLNRQMRGCMIFRFYAAITRLTSRARVSQQAIKAVCVMYEAPTNDPRNPSYSINLHRLNCKSSILIAEWTMISLEACSYGLQVGQSNALIITEIYLPPGKINLNYFPYILINLTRITRSPAKTIVYNLFPPQP